MVLRCLQITHVLCLGWLRCHALLPWRDKSGIIDPCSRFLDLLACDASMGQPKALVCPRACISCGAHQLPVIIRRWQDRVVVSERVADHAGLFTSQDRAVLVGRRLLEPCGGLRCVLLGWRRVLMSGGQVMMILIDQPCHTGAFSVVIVLRGRNLEGQVSGDWRRWITAVSFVRELEIRVVYQLAFVLLATTLVLLRHG